MSDNVPTFKRAPLSQEILNTKAKQTKFDSLPEWQRQFVSELVTKGDFKKAAEESQISHYVKKSMKEEWKRANSLVTALNDHGVDAKYVAKKLKDCLDAEVLKFDKNGKPHTLVDFRVRIKALEMMIKIMQSKDDSEDPAEDAELLFQDVDTDDDET